ncbi:hypothetical protein C1Y14_34315, partial [Pseudomonas sp. MPR-R5B]
MTGHPRLLMRASDVDMYRGWANANNPIWTALDYLGESRKLDMDLNTIQDNGGGTTGFVTTYESYAELFALLSLVHPDAAKREDYAN